jgi:hypothetical protein
MYKLHTDRKGQIKLITHNLQARIKQQNINTEGHAMTQLVAGPYLVRLGPNHRPYGICGGQSGSGAGLSSPGTLVSSC